MLWWGFTGLRWRFVLLRPLLLRAKRQDRDLVGHAGKYKFQVVISYITGVDTGLRKGCVCVGGGGGGGGGSR